MVFLDAMRFLAKAARCPSFWYCAKAGRLDCAACGCWLRRPHRVRKFRS